MAGFSSRFYNSGYTKPKYKLPLKGKTVFEWVMLSFENYFESQHFKFIVKSEYEDDSFTRNMVMKLGIKSYSIHFLNSSTRGQAETVYLSIIEETADQELLIFNIDTIRKNFLMPSIPEDIFGYLEIFKGDGDHWSFVEPIGEGSNLVKRTTEKLRISNLCSNGMYFFRSLLKFREICFNSINSNDLHKGEFYIAPLYNTIIELGLKVQYIETSIEDNIFCGTPYEYEKLLLNTDLSLF